MDQIGIVLGSLFGGVFGIGIGFFIIAFVAVLLALPYILLTRNSESPAAGMNTSGGITSKPSKDYD